MSCSRVRRELSSYLDGDLSGAEMRAVAAHLEHCADCRCRRSELAGVSETLGSLPTLTPPEPIAPLVLDRLEVESRGPGLALLFRSAWAARPLMIPSILPAALILACTLSSVLVMGGRDLDVSTGARARLLAAAQTEWGTDANPFWATGYVRGPRSGADFFVDQQLMGLEEQTIFVLTTVSQDGRVSDVRLLEGDERVAEPILHELKQQRCLPGDLAGRAVATRSLRLISAVEVRAPRT